MTFDALNLSSLLKKTLSQLNYTLPTEIQKKAIPVILAGKDILAAAQTGTGKTAAFSLPVLERLSKEKKQQNKNIRALILAPTRELAAQIGQSLNEYGKDMAISTAVVYGGVKINPQITKLKQGVDILVATPGRLLDLYQQEVINFSQCQYVVLDEADRMLDMGFVHDIRRIFSHLPKKRQTLLFSATFSKPVRTLAKEFVHQAEELSVSPQNSTTELVNQVVCPVEKKRKPALLVHLIHQKQWTQVLVFTKTKHKANRLVTYLEGEGIVAAAIHGNKSQSARLKALDGFKSGKIRVLVATDIAARGLDIHQLPLVVNFELPQTPEDYVHRIGRTGRAGASGEATSLVCPEEFLQLRAIERLTKQVLPRTSVKGFTINQDSSSSSLNKNSGKPSENRRNAPKKTSGSFKFKTKRKKVMA